MCASGPPAPTVVVSDLRGYGDSGKIEGDPEHHLYSKRAIALDQVEVMRHFGFERFSAFGYDRGGRVTHRLALDHPANVERTAVLDIIPTHYLFSRVDKAFAESAYHWFFFARPAPFPETVDREQPRALRGPRGSNARRRIPARVPHSRHRPRASRVSKCRAATRSRSRIRPRRPPSCARSSLPREHDIRCAAPTRFSSRSLRRRGGRRLALSRTQLHDARDLLCRELEEPPERAFAPRRAARLESVRVDELAAAKPVRLDRSQIRIPAPDDIAANLEFAEPLEVGARRLEHVQVGSPGTLDEEHRVIVEDGRRFQARRLHAVRAGTRNEFGEIELFNRSHARRERSDDGLGLCDGGVVATDQRGAHRLGRGVAAGRGELGLDAGDVVPDSGNVMLRCDDQRRRVFPHVGRSRDRDEPRHLASRGCGIETEQQQAAENRSRAHSTPVPRCAPRLVRACGAVNREGSVDGIPLDVEQQAFVQGDRLSAEIDLRLTGIGGPDDDIALLPIGSLSVHTSLRRGEFVVLGEGQIDERQDLGRRRSDIRAEGFKALLFQTAPCAQRSTGYRQPCATCFCSPSSRA